MRLKRVALSFCAWAICAAVMSGRRESLISAVVRRQVCFPRICIKRNPPGLPPAGNGLTRCAFLKVTSVAWDTSLSASL